MDIKSKHHIISIPSAVILMACASLVFFLPAAISMNVTAPSDITDVASVKIDLHQATELTVGPNAESSEEETIIPTAGQNTYHDARRLPDGDSPDIRNYKGSLSLKTAATIGASSAVAAAFLASGAGNIPASP